MRGASGRAASAGAWLRYLSEPIADAAYGLDETRLLGIVAQAPAQVGDVDIDEMLVGRERMAPDAIEQGWTPEHGAGLAGEGGEKVEFERGWLDDPTVDA